MAADYSLDALARFFDYAAEKGLMKRQTAMGRKGAALNVLAVLDEAETKDLRNVDVDDASRRFSNTRGGDYKPESLRVYSSRTRSALSEFIRYVDDPASFKPSIPQRKRHRKAESNNGNGNGNGIDATAPNPPPHPANEPREDSARERRSAHDLAIPIPIRDGVIVRLQGVPADLSAPEAEKIANVIKAYARVDG